MVVGSEPIVTGGLPVLAVAGSGIEELLLDLLPIFILAAGVGIVVAKLGRVPYTIALLLAGFAIAVLGIEIDVELSHDLILLVLLPPLLFEGAATTDLERFRRNVLYVVALATAGLVVSIVLLGTVGSYAFDFPLLLGLLFAAMILPTDPVSVLALFEELGAPDRLATLVEGESLVNDGVGVVIFTTLLALVEESQASGRALEELVTPGRLWQVAAEILVASGGGLLVGLVAGYVVYRVMVNLDEHMTETVLTFILAYGAFLLAEHYFHVSGVIATVAAGLLLGNRGAEYAMSPRTKLSVFDTWDTAAFLVNTLIFLLIGAKTPIDQLIDHAPLILVAIPLVLAARAAVVYPITTLLNRIARPPVSREYQHVMVWGGLHASIPIALVLGLPVEFPLREELRAMVFGVAAFSLVVQGLTMRHLLDGLDIVTRSEIEELYELLLGRARAVDAALDTAERLHEANRLPGEVYEDFRVEYGREKEQLTGVIAELVRAHPELRREELLVGERRILQEEKSAVREAIRTGLVAGDVGERLIGEIDLKLDRVFAGESTITDEPEEGYEEFWRRRAEAVGLDVPQIDAADADRGGRSSPESKG